MGSVMGVFDIVVERNVRRRRVRAPLSEKKRAAALFKLWHGMREFVSEAERLGDSELVHLLAVTQMLVEDRVTAVTTGTTAFEGLETSLPN
jgi:hypothetical protein